MNTPDEQAALRALMPLLDEALLSLREKDRSALLLRFYEGQSLRMVGTGLGISEDAAQKRVSSALEKVSTFFRRRGFRTATAGVAAAALQQTALSAPAAVAASVAAATAQVAPAVLVGWMGLAARAATLTKFQTAAACVVLVAGPALWQWRSGQQAIEEQTALRAQLTQSSAELSKIQREIERFDTTAAQLTQAATEAAARPQRAVASDQIAAWRKRLMALLADPKGRWPDDFPFVRIPKSALKELTVEHPVTPPGTIQPQQRELLGLSAEERDQCETALRNHFATVDDLVETKIAETNQFSHFQVPTSASNSIGWFVPPLGEAATSSGAELEQDLQNILGPERWSLAAAQFDFSKDSPGRILGLDVGKDEQEVSAWIQNENGQWQLGYGVSAHNGTTVSTSPLETFGPNPDGTDSTSKLLEGELGNLPDAVSHRILAWAQQQASLHLGRETAK